MSTREVTIRIHGDGAALKEDVLGLSIAARGWTLTGGNIHANDHEVLTGGGDVVVEIEGLGFTARGVREGEG